MISIPEVSHKSGIFRVAFTDERVWFRLERPREDKYGSVTFEVTVVTDLPIAAEATLHQALPSTKSQRMPRLVSGTRGLLSTRD